MEIRLFAGAHRTATQHFATALAINIEALQAENIMYTPASRRTLKRMSDALTSIGNGVDIDEVRRDLMTRLVDSEGMERLIIVSPNLLGKASRPFGDKLLYARARGLVGQFQNMFHGHDVRYFISVRNPATFLASCYAQSILEGRFVSFEEYLGSSEYMEFRWSSLLHRIQGKEAEIPITVWRYEDYRYIWRDIIAAFTGVSTAQGFMDIDQDLGVGLSLEGAQLMHEFAMEQPEQIKEAFEEIKEAFEKSHPSSPNKIVAPNWPQEVVRELTYNYEDDWYYIERMDNVQTIQPRNFEFTNTES